MNKTQVTGKKNLSGSQAVLESLLEEGVDTVFGYPGGQIIPVYDALYDYFGKINHTLVRHEQGAIHAAQGYARATGKVGVCIVTSGPGATNTVTGLADAMMDSTPVVVISGQVSSGLLGTDAFQETNFIGITQAVTKWNCLVKRAEDIPEVMAKAFYIAKTGRPGPVVVDIAKDAQIGRVDFEYNKVNYIRSYNPYPKVELTDVDKAAQLINTAKRPMVLVGQGVTLGNAEEELLAFLEKTGMPVASTLLGLSTIPSKYKQFVGMLGMHGNYAPNIKNKDCDLLVAIGLRFNDRVTGNPAKFGVNAKVIHMDIDSSEINKIVHADVPVVGDVKESLPMLTKKVVKREHQDWLREFHKCYHLEYERIIEKELYPMGCGIRMGEVVNKVSNACADNSILVTDVGQQQMIASRYFKFKHKRSIITSGGLGTMGFGLPAAMGAKIGARERDVFLFVGDGGFQMNLQELGTIYQSKIPVKIVLLNNSYLGMVRQWQELFFDRRYSFTAMTNPDFGLIAEANGIKYSCVDDRENLDDAIEEMIDHQGAYLLEVRVEKEDNVFPMVPAGCAVTDIRLE